MKSHNGMRPQDVVILIKVLQLHGQGWQYRQVAACLYLSVSEVAESLQRSHVAGLIDESKKRVYRENLMEFVEHGLHYVFPAVPATMVTGVPTAHSQVFFKSKFRSELEYVWEHEEGSSRGLSIMPLYKGAPRAALGDVKLHTVLAAIDIYRVGRVREINTAREVLHQAILL